MGADIVEYGSLRKYKALGAILTPLVFVLGFTSSLSFVQAEDLNLLEIVPVFFGCSILVSFFGFLLGWTAKKNAVTYSKPEWEYSTIQLELDEVHPTFDSYKQEFSKLIPLSSFWSFYIPIVMVLFAISLPFIAFHEYPWLTDYVPILFGLILSLLLPSSLFGAFRAASNAASEDFALPLIREAMWIAAQQRDISGVSHVRLMIDEARIDGYRIYENPRALIRLDGLEKDSYIVSWSFELKAINRVFCRLLPKGDREQVVWWWDGRDPYFRKYVGEDRTGYYVRNPVRSHLDVIGVKDVGLVTRNAIAVVVSEWIRHHSPSERFVSLLHDIEAESPVE